MSKTSLQLLMIIGAVVTMVACSQGNNPVEIQPSSNLSETQHSLITTTYRRQSDKHEGVWTDMELVHQDGEIKEFWLRYNFQISEKLLEESGLSSKEEQVTRFRDALYTSSPELSQLEQLEGVFITDNLNEEGLWKFSIRINPDHVDFKALKETVGEGDFEILADVEDTTPGELLLIFKMAGFEEISR